MLLADDLYNFAGDKDELATKLWEQHKLWNENIMLGVITFITKFSHGYKKRFLPALQDQSASIDTRLAIIRYYKKYHFMPAQHILLECLYQTENYDIAIEAASALSTYPGFITTSALKQALQSENWDVKYNAASTLVELGENLDSFNHDIKNCDSDVMQIIKYRLAIADDEQYVNVREVAI